MVAAAFPTGRERTGVEAWGDGAEEGAGDGGGDLGVALNSSSDTTL